jgi:uncharacterized membrane-anchored protein YhcB (DUF1043 family)
MPLGVAVFLIVAALIVGLILGIVIGRQESAATRFDASFGPEVDINPKNKEK